MTPDETQRAKWAKQDLATVDGLVGAATSFLADRDYESVLGAIDEMRSLLDRVESRLEDLVT